MFPASSPLTAFLIPLHTQPSGRSINNSLIRTPLNRHLCRFLMVSMGAILLILCMRVVAGYEIVFSDDVTTDFAKGSIDVPGLIGQDFLALPVVGGCGLASKFTTPHVFATPTINGTLYTTFEYLTHDCTAEYKRDNNTCGLLTAAFTPCLMSPFPYDRRTCNRPWGYCSNSNFRLSYMWDSNQTIHQLRSSQKASGAGTRGGRLDTGCDWRFSNLVPVAWDGVQNVLAVGERLQSPDLRYALVMQGDCNLVLYEKGADGKYEFNAKWAAYSQFNDPFLHNCSAVLQPNGNLVVMDPGGRPRWASNGTSSSWYTSALAVLRNGTVAVYEMNSGAVLWSTG